MKRLGIYLVLFVAFAAAVGGLMPFHDDWSYSTAPNPDFTWAQLLPSLAFWRPFDVLWGALMAKWPVAFPVANRLVVVLAHTISVYIISRILERLPGDGSSRRVGTAFFALSPSVAALVVNSDTINQSWSFVCGEAALLVILSGMTNRGLKISLFALLLILSLLFKESGVSWFVVIPAVQWLRTRNLRGSVRFCAGTMALLLLYFCARFLLLGRCVLGDGQYYALGFAPERIIINLVMSIFAAISSIDILALVYGNWLLFLSTGVLAAAFFVTWFVSANREMSVITCAVAAFIAVAMAIPHCCFKGHHPAEMHFYPILFAGALMVATQPSDILKRSLRCGSIICMCLLFSLGWSHKMWHTYGHSARTRALFEKLRAMKIDYSKPVYFIVEDDRSIRYYSVFSHSAAHGLDCGRACRAFNEWRDFDFHMAYTALERAAIPYGSQTVRIK